MEINQKINLIMLIFKQTIDKEIYINNKIKYEFHEDLK